MLNGLNKYKILLSYSLTAQKLSQKKRLGSVNYFLMEVNVWNIKISHLCWLKRACTLPMAQF